jgi:sugar fermentation stimulation protein A
MKFKTKLIEGRFLKRYKRFFADIEITHFDGKKEIVVSHTANTGSMKTCIGENWRAMLSYHDDPKRKLKYSLEMTSNEKTWIGINTSLTNHLAIEAINSGLIPELKGYQNLKPEVKIGDSRIDILLSNSSDDQCFVEVKNVTLVENGNALFPDAVTERGQKHLNELMTLKEKGIRAVMLFIIQREDCSSFSLTNPIDPEYSKLLKKAIYEGVEVLIYQCKVGPLEIIVNKRLDILD